MAAALVAASRFKLLDVTAKVSIREFTTRNGLDFAAGKGFYELTKPEIIQDYKEIVAVRRADGTKVTGSKVRELLGVSSSAAKFKLDTNMLRDFKIFVQSTSYNRVLMPDTQFLYEVGDAGASSTSFDGAAHDRPAPPPSGAGMPIEIVFSFDTTGSMSSVLDCVRRRLKEIIQRLQNDIPGIRIAVFAHGDYCDASSTYVTKHIDFTTDAATLCEWVEKVKSTGGGDFEECYELVLKEAREKLSWTPGTQRALVMIGDATPHEPKDYSKCNILKKFPLVVWKDEVDNIVRNTGCRVYAVQCQDHTQSTYFWKYLAHHTHGYHLNLNNFDTVFDFIMAICYREQGPEQLQAYRAEVEERARSSGGMNADLHRLFEALGVSPAEASGAAAPPAASAAAAAETLAIAPAISSAPETPARKRKAPAKSAEKAAKKARVAAKAPSAAPRSARGAAAPKKASPEKLAGPRARAAKPPASARAAALKRVAPPPKVAGRGPGVAQKKAASSVKGRRSNGGKEKPAKGKAGTVSALASTPRSRAARRPIRKAKESAPSKKAPRRPKRK